VVVSGLRKISRLLLVVEGLSPFMLVIGCEESGCDASVRKAFVSQSWYCACPGTFSPVIDCSSFPFCLGLCVVELMALVLEQEVPVRVLLLLKIDTVLVSPESDASPERECRTLIVCILGCCVRPTPESYPVCMPIFEIGYFDSS
jgi:hypothetical protein